MSLVFAIIPLAVMVVFYGAVTKLAAKLFKGSRIQWKHAFIFALTAGVVGTFVAIISKASGLVPSLPLGLVFGLTVQAVLGGWYLGPRGERANGEPLAFKGGFAVSGLSSAILFTVSFALLLLSQALLPAVAR
jgi:hypothetical protein